VSASERGRDQLIDASEVAAPFAFDEQRSGPRTQPAQHRPIPHFGLGDEARRRGGVDDENIQPGDVIGGDENGRFVRDRALEP
jgi:hypothetical protein